MTIKFDKCNNIVKYLIYVSHYNKIAVIDNEHVTPFITLYQNLNKIVNTTITILKYEVKKHDCGVQKFVTDQSVSLHGAVAGGATLGHPPSPLQRHQDPCDGRQTPGRRYQRERPGQLPEYRVVVVLIKSSCVYSYSDECEQNCKCTHIQDNICIYLM